jgi:hypothetical protein
MAGGSGQDIFDDTDRDFSRDLVLFLDNLHFSSRFNLGSIFSVHNKTTQILLFSMKKRGPFFKKGPVRLHMILRFGQKGNLGEIKGTAYLISGINYVSCPLNSPQQSDPEEKNAGLPEFRDKLSL